MAEHSLTQAYNFDRTVDAYALHLAVSSSAPERWKVFGIMSTVTALLFWFVAFDGESVGGFLPWVVVSLLLGALLAWMPNRLNRLGLKRRLKSYWEQMGVEGKLTTYRFDDKQLTIDDDMLGGKLAWIDIYAWRDDENFLLIYRAPQFFYYIDKDMIEPVALNALIDCLSSSLGKRL